MKKKLMILLSILSLITLTSCGDSDSNSESTSVSSQPVPTSSEQPATIYNDGIVKFEYSNSLLQANRYDDDTSEYDYILVIAQPDADFYNAVLNGNCIYICTPEYDADMIDFCKKYPVETTKALYDGIFQYENGSEASVVQLSDGLYEYTLSASDYTYKGKILSVNNNQLTVLVYRVSTGLSSDLINAFENCYSNIVLISAPENTSSDAKEHLAELDKEAEEKASASQKITEGPLYESITNIYSDVTIIDMVDSISISINLTHNTYEEDSINFFDILTSICNNCELENNYSSVIFSMFVDDSYTAMLTLVNYTSPTSFSSVPPLIQNEEYEEIMQQLYSIIFLQNDVENNFDKNLDSIKEQYGVSN